MDRLIAANTVAVGSGDVAPATGTPGQATDGNPATGVAPTIFPAYAWNMLTEEMRAVVVAAGITPSGSNLTQLLTALGVLFGGGGSLNANGWQRLPGGLIVQWGSGNSGTNGFTAITYPTAFPSASFITIAGEQNAAGWIGTSSTGGTPSVHGAFNRSLTGCSLYSQQWNAGSDLWVGTSGIAYGFITLGK